MRPSPIQLRHVIYTKVAVAPSVSEKNSVGKTIGFDFNGVNIRAKVGVAGKPGQEDDPRDFLIDLEITIDNAEGKTAPYNVDIGVIGVFNVLPGLPKEKRESLVTVNGASILYGAIREIVLSLTSRFASGVLTLPGMNFEDAVTRNGAIHSTPSIQTAEQKPIAPRRAKKSRQ